ncbi:MAG TPA: VWA domain-containing protein [Gammaproteobacteria bacterium]
MAEFHFLRPLWLLALPPGLWLIWKLVRSGGIGGRWRTLVDEALQPFVLTGTDVVVRERHTAMLAAMSAWALSTIALAGPTWDRLPVPAVRSEEALVAVLDLSRSMDAVDVEPTRMTRARLKLLSLLERRESGQTGLVVFSAHAFTVAPLTSDVSTIALLVASLTSDIMPSRGSYPEAGLDKAAQLLRQTGLPRGEILLISDSDVSPTSLNVAERLYREGYTVHVLSVGTEDGGPIVVPGGGFLTDDAGQVVVPRVDVSMQRRLAQAGGGRFAQLTADDRDLDYLLSGVVAAAPGLVGADESEMFEIDAWRDQGLWLVLLIVPLVALAFRRGWVVTLAACFLVAQPEAGAQELAWADLWQTRDQQGQTAFDSEEHTRAGELFEDAEWRAAAQFRAEQFAESAATLDGIDTPDANYNRGNALAGDGQIGPAIEAYERALELDPGHEDARYNRELLLQQPQQNQSQSGEGEGDDSQQNDQQSEQQPTTGEPGAEDDPQNAQSGSEQQEEQQLAAEQEEAEQGDPEEIPQGEMPTAGDLEEWEDEQAAEQWLRRIPQDPGGLLRRKFLYQYQRLGVDQDGNYVWPGDEMQPW